MTDGHRSRLTALTAQRADRRIQPNADIRPSMTSSGATENNVGDDNRIYYLSVCPSVEASLSFL